MPKVETKTHIIKNAMLKALEKTLGVVQPACKLVCDELGLKNPEVIRRQHYEWLKSDETYKLEVEDKQDIVLDFAESNLFKLIDKGDTPATIFLLKTIGKKRGYIERSEIDHTTKGDKISFNIGFTEENDND